MTPNRSGNASFCREGDSHARTAGRIDEFLGSYVKEYQEVCATACKRHRSLIGIFECADDVFYEATASERLEHFSLGRYSVVTFRSARNAPIAARRSDSLIDHLSISTRPTDAECGGLTYVLTCGSKRHTSIFIRKSIGLSKKDCEVEAMIKLVVLFHELGHVNDIEKGRNYRRHTVDPLHAEVYAHHFACRAMIKDKYRIALGWYLDQLAEMTDDEAAVRFSKSREYGVYQREISPLYKCGKATTA